jgi:hypothetical protein
MGEIDPEHIAKLAVDEWGSWYGPGDVHVSAGVGNQADLDAGIGEGEPVRRLI